MKAAYLPIVITGIVALTMGPSRALAQSPPPPEKSVTYLIRTNPSDPESPVSHSVELRLVQAKVEGNLVGWHAEWIKITSYDQEGDAEAAWINFDPAFQTSEGLWEIEHVNSNDPQTEEFVSPPWIQGTADAEAPGSGSLDYSVVASTPGNGNPAMPYRITARLNYSFLASPGDDPIEGEDEPVETPEGDDEPL